MNVVNITIKITLVPHGYEFDIFDRNGVLVASTCRDFGGNYDVGLSGAVLIRKIRNMFEDLEQSIKYVEKRSVQNDRP